jgi:hypothetical protein
MAGFDPGPGARVVREPRPAPLAVARATVRHRLRHRQIGDNLATFSPQGGRLIDVSWGIIICDRVSPRGTVHILDHVPQLRVATY